MDSQSSTTKSRGKTKPSLSLPPLKYDVNPWDKKLNESASQLKKNIQEDMDAKMKGRFDAPDVKDKQDILNAASRALVTNMNTAPPLFHQPAVVHERELAKLNDKIDEGYGIRRTRGEILDEELEDGFISISPEDLDNGLFSEDIWFEIESKTLLTCYKRYGVKIAVAEFHKKFNVQGVKSKRVIRFTWEDDILLEVYHDRDNVYAKLFTGTGSIHGMFPKNPKQGSVISSWTEFKGSRDTRALADGRNVRPPSIKSLDGKTQDSLITFTPNGFDLNLSLGSKSPVTEEKESDNSEGLPEWLNEINKNDP